MSLKSPGEVESQNTSFFLRPRRIRGKYLRTYGRIRGKKLSLYREYVKSGLFAVHKIISQYAESIEPYSENMRKESTVCVHGEDAKKLLAYSHNTPRDIKVHISQLIIIQI